MPIGSRCAATVTRVLPGITPVKHTLERNSVIAGQLIHDGRLHVDELISHRIRPEQMPAVYAGMREKSNDYAGVLVDWR